MLFGTAEWSVHLFPMLVGLLALGLFWQACCKSFSPIAAGFAVCVLAVAYYPVRHACEVKPYAFDLLYAVVYLWLTLKHMRSCDPSPHPREDNRWLAALAIVTPIAVFSSYPSVFVGGAVSIVLLPDMRTGSWTRRIWFALFNIALVGSFLIHYGMIGHHQVDAEEAARTREFLRNYWKDAFPPDEIVQWPLWLVKVFTGNMLAYPIGAKNGGSTLTLLFVLIGSVSLWRDGKRALLALCWLPFGLNLIAALLNKYPFGDSARITLHLAPFICILMAHGLAAALEWIRDPTWRSRVHLAIHVALLAYGIISIGRDLASPYKTEHDRDVRLLARDIGQRVAPAEPIVLGHQRDEDVLPEFLWNLRAQRLDLRWQSAGVGPGANAYWLVQCSNQEPSPLAAPPGWRITSSEVRCVPPENAKMPPMYCRWARLVRD
ncbi:MAG: glycosyltransferase family 39 protein [Planctomycetes bacterium]|nr:glycosyltransferase family 39 protein [Planctomycetota bacterium]